jgi:putative oxidoreductase
MDRWLGRYSEPLYSIMRLIAGLLFSFHGAQKLFGAFGGQQMVSNPKMLLAGIVEISGLLVAVGLGASWAAFVASGEMAFAYFTAHAPGGLLPIVNKGELAVLYCFVFLYIAARGSGWWSVDALLLGKPARVSGLTAAADSRAGSASRGGAH